MAGSHDQAEEQGVRESLHIDAKPEAVYAAISDVTRMGEWSPEATGAVVLSSGPITTGTRFRGTNQRTWAKWATQCTVVAADPGRCFAFEVRALGGPVSRWEYEFAEESGGTQVTEIWTDRRHGVHGLLISAIGMSMTRAAGRIEHNRRMMRETLRNLKQHLEQPQE